MNFTTQIKNFKEQLKARGLILMYHRIVQMDTNSRQLNVSPDHFEEHLQVLNKYGVAVTMRNMGKNLKRYAFGRKEIVVTLDDGYADNFHNAKPLLEKYGISATFFIVSGVLDSKDEFFWDGLERTILVPKTLPEFLEIEIGAEKYAWRIAQEGPCQLLNYSEGVDGIPKNGSILTRTQLYIILVRLIGLSLAEERKCVLGQLFQWAGRDLTARPDCLPMTREELTALAKNRLFEIGAHTVNHPMLSYLPIERQEEEISRSKRDLENILDKEITSFSYPHGEYRPETVKALERMKFRNACTVVERPVARECDPFQMPRFGVQDWKGDAFEQNLQRWLKVEL